MNTEYTISYKTGADHPFGRYITQINPDNNIKMAVYGDSFGDGPRDKNTNGAVNIHNWWMSQLAIRLNLHSVENFSSGGTPFLFTYNNFMNNYMHYDINIVLVTSPYRYSKMIQLPSIDSSEQYYGSSVVQCEGLINRNLPPEEHKKVVDISTWHMVNDNTYMDLTQDLMLKEILRISPNTILIPCFFESIPSIKFSLMELVQYQNRTLGVNQQDYEEIPGIIGCHLTPEMNTVLADMVFHRMITGEWNFKFPHIKHQHPKEYYFRKRENR